jgi:polysaccharide export outer membrane protein
MKSELVGQAKAANAVYQVVMVTHANLQAVQGWPATGSGIGFGWPSKGQSQVSRLIRPGDRLHLTVWDPQENSLLTTVEQRSATMEALVVAPDGTVFVPYIDLVTVGGLSPEAARAEIQQRLTAIAPSAQVQLAVAEGQQNTIDLVSGVQKPGRYPVATQGVTILSMLAEGGGIPPALRNPVVRLQRGDTSYAILAQELYRSSDRDILLRGGDRVVVEEDPRSFIVLGAAGAEKTVAFQKVSHTLLEGLSLSAGLSEARADPRGVLVLRQYGDKALRSDGRGPAKRDVIFAFDLSTGDGLFAARSFSLHPDDVVLVTESPLPAAAGIVGVFNATAALADRVGG